MRARKALEEQLRGHGSVKPDVQRLDMLETREKSTRMRRTASPLPVVVDEVVMPMPTFTQRYSDHSATRELNSITSY